MSALPQKLRHAVAIAMLIGLVSISCNNEKADELPPSNSGETNPEQMPMKKLNPDSSSEMPVIITPDSTANMPNGYDSSKKRLPPPR